MTFKKVTVGKKKQVDHEIDWVPTKKDGRREAVLDWTSAEDTFSKALRWNQWKCLILLMTLERKKDKLSRNRLGVNPKGWEKGISPWLDISRGHLLKDLVVNLIEKPDPLDDSWKSNSRTEKRKVEHEIDWVPTKNAERREAVLDWTSAEDTLSKTLWLA